MTNATRVWVDGDSLVYRCGFAAEKTYYLVGNDSGSNEENQGWIFKQYDNAKEAKASMIPHEAVSFQIWSRKEIEPLDHCLATVKNSLNKIVKAVDSEDLFIYISGTGNFRKDLDKTYKQNRDTLPKPKYFNDIRQYLIDHWGAMTINRCEPDDWIGVQNGEDPGIIVCQDKDLNQIPGDHYNWVTGERYNVTPEQGLRFFYSQLLTGDPTDNIPGLEGCGIVGATKICGNCRNPSELARAAYEAYRSKYQEATDEIINRQATLVWIWRKMNDKHPLWRHLGRASI